MTAKYGTIASDDKSLTATRSVHRFKKKGIGVRHPFEWVITEATPFQVPVVDEQGRIHDRLTLTLVMDVYSRVILGFHLGFDREHRSEDCQALRDAMDPKKCLEKLYPDLAGAYPVEDIIEGALTISESVAVLMKTRFATAGRSLGICDETTKEAAQKHKASAERALASIVYPFADLLPGGTRFDVRHWKRRELEQEGSMTLEEARSALRRWIVQIYHHTPHRSLERKTPLQKWAEGMRKLGLNPPGGGESRSLRRWLFHATNR